MKHYVYRLFAADGSLLYVGVSKDPWQRFRGHQYRAAWSSQVQRGRICVYPTLDEAMAAEVSAIREERPRFNVVHNRDGRREVAPPLHADERSWFLVRVYDREGCLLKVGFTRSLETWIRNHRTQEQTLSPWVAHMERIHMAGPYTKATVLDLVRDHRIPVAS